MPNEVRITTSQSQSVGNPELSAMEISEQLYKLGSPCPQGHTFGDTGQCLRYKGAEGRCVECRRERTRQYVSKNPDKIKSQRHSYYQRNVDKSKARNRAWVKANPEKRAAILARYESSHVEELRERRRIQVRADRERNPDQHRARTLINTHVRRGKLPPASALPCVDCGHVWQEGDSRHEYDHYEGYQSASSLRVESVCRDCHVLRTTGRKEQAA